MSSQDVQQKRLNKGEEALLRLVFKDREDLLLLMRNLFFGFELTVQEKEVIKNTFKEEGIRKIVRKIILPELQADIPIGQNIDLWMTVQIDGKLPEEIATIFESREKLIGILDESLKLLENPDYKKMRLQFDTMPSLVDLVARNSFITHIEFQLGVIRTLANQKEESPEEKVKRVKKDSNR